MKTELSKTSRFVGTALLGAALVTACLLVTSPSAFAAEYTLSTFTLPANAAGAQVRSLSDDGQVVGVYYDSAFTGRAFTWREHFRDDRKLHGRGRRHRRL